MAESPDRPCARPRAAALLTAAVAVTALAACDGRIYVRDGVTDGDTFYLPQYVLADDSADLQSWVAYSLDRSTCQLMMGGDNPARNHSWDCELGARQTLVETWQEQRYRKDARDEYLDTLAAVQEAGYLDEYVWHYHARNDWRRPPDLEQAAFERWRETRLDDHRPRTRIIGSWNYARMTGSLR
jgi:hypothetical protein